MTPTLERILEEIKTLTPEEKGKVREALDREPVRPRNVALIRELRGKYKHVLGSTEEFMARKQEDIDLEDRRFRR